MTTKPSTEQIQTIAENRKARYNYFIEESFEAGISLFGWEVKSIRAGRVQLSEAHVIFKNSEAWLLNAHISPLVSASTHVETNPLRTRKILLHKNEINRLIGHVERKGYSVVPLSIYLRQGKIKLQLALARGKKKQDKRATLKERDWQREKQRAFKR